MILDFIVIYNLYIILTKNRLWIPFFFLTAYLFFPSNFLYLLQTTSFSILGSLALAYGFYHFKSKYDISKITFNDKKYFIINADRRFPIGTFVLFKLLQLMPEIMIEANQKLNSIHPEQSMNSDQLIQNLQPLISYMPYINIFVFGYFFILGIFYMHQNLSLPEKK